MKLDKIVKELRKKVQKTEIKIVKEENPILKLMMSMELRKIQQAVMILETPIIGQIVQGMVPEVQTGNLPTSPKKRFSDN